MAKKSIFRLLVVVTLFSGALTCSAKENEHMSTADTTEHQFTNHLITENSPYLLSHAHNPVNWYPWGEEALAAAKTQNKPIFLSIGYSACHWCHVMERESFENEEIAALMNEYFISIKVDREQRPDLDEIYMTFTTALTGGGGWPMSVFLTPDRKPFYAGTYFPPEDRYGRPGFRSLLTQLGTTWRENEVAVTGSATKIFGQVTARLMQLTEQAALKKEMISRGASALMGNFDQTNGGFGNRPKFPHATELTLLLRQFRSSSELRYFEAVEKSLQAMARGGIYDQVGGGFARYATDAKWVVPHFEKMLYDNGLLVPLYVEAYQLTKNELYLDVVKGTLDFVLREMTDSEGGFYSALDADSEGEEGKFYVWSYEEVEELLGADNVKLFADYYNISKRGNFEGENILHINSVSDKVKEKHGASDFNRRMADGRHLLFEARRERIRPHTDDKILTSWNGLALTALCSGYQITGDRRYLKAATNNARFVKETMFSDGHLIHAYREGIKSSGEFLEDYSFYIRGLLSLYESDSKGNHEWLQFAVSLADRALDQFVNADGKLFLRPSNQTDLIYRPQEESDGAIPSAGSMFMASLLKLNRITGDNKYLESAVQMLDAISGQLQRAPSRMSSALLALDYYFNDKIEIVIVGEGKIRDQMVDLVYNQYLPNRIIALSSDGNDPLPLFEGRKYAGTVTAYVCRNSVCKLPVSSVEELRQQIDQL